MATCPTTPSFDDEDSITDGSSDASGENLASEDTASLSGRELQLFVGASSPGHRIDHWLRTQVPSVSRMTFKRLIDLGHVRVNDRPVKATHRPKAGERIVVFFPEAQPATALPEAIALNILFEDDDLLVVNKAPGMVVHPGEGVWQNTLVNALLHHCAGQLSGVGGIARPGIVHRLDRDTSGAMVVAKNDSTHVGLSDQFKARQTYKVYHALALGELTQPAGEIEAAIARHPSHRKSMTVAAGGREALTTYSRLERFPGATYVGVRIHTGRTHQIRVHFQFIGHPLLGDTAYGKNQNKRFTAETGIEAPRQMLHAHTLEFIHPRSEKTLRFTAPLPEDFRNVLESLRNWRDRQK